MKKEDYLREIKSAGHDLSIGVKKLGVAVNPLGLLRTSISQKWHWWLPAAGAGGFITSKILRAITCGKKKTRGKDAPRPAGAAYWIPILLKFLPAMTAQLVPLILSLRSNRKP